MTTSRFEDMERRVPIQFSIRSILLVIVVAAAILGITTHFKVPEILFGTVSLAGSWFLIRFTRAHVQAIVPLFVGAWALSCALTAELYRDDLFVACQVALLGNASMVLAFVISFVSVMSLKGNWRANAGCAALAVLMTLIFWWLFGGPLAQRRAAVHKQRVAQTIQAAQNLVSAIEAIRSSQGRLPLDEAELELLLAGPLPCSGWSDRFTYRRDESDPQHYRISCLTEGFAANFYEYDSRTPERGVFTYPF